VKFSCKIVLSDYARRDGMKLVYLQAIIDRAAARVSMDFYINEKYFDAKGQGSVKSSHPNADTYNTELQMAIAKAQHVASQFRIKNKRITADLFRSEFINPSDEVDVIRYIEKELELRIPELAPNTVKQHNTVINKLKAFQKVIKFIDVSPEMMQKFKNHLKKEKLSDPSINKLLRIVKQYLSDAARKGHEFQDPFVSIKIKSFKSNRLALSERELNSIDEYYQKDDTIESHKKLLRYFLFSCYTGLRISDIAKITWNNIHDDLLVYTPTKTKSKGETVTVPITREKKYLPEFKAGNKPVFETFSDPVSNRYLKKVAEKLKITKNITFHTSRHTFGTLMAEGGHLTETQKMMGHSDIKTTMGYIHTSNKSVIDAKHKRFGNHNETPFPNMETDNKSEN